MADFPLKSLEVVGDLMVEMGGTTARIEARGASILVELPSLRSGASIYRQWSGFRGRREAVRRIHDGLSKAGLTLRVTVGDRTIGLLGVGTRAGLFTRLLGFGPVEVRVGGLLGAIRRPADRRE